MTTDDIERLVRAVWRDAERAAGKALTSVDLSCRVSLCEHSKVEWQCVAYFDAAPASARKCHIGRGTTVGGAIIDVLAKIEPEPNLAAILGIEEAAS